MADDILVKQDGPILRITLNAPDRGNAVTDDNVRELTRLIAEAPKASDIVVLRGAGKDFCVGRAGMGARPEVEPTAYARRNFSDVVFDAYGAMRNCPIPIIAVVQGGAHGFGCAIAAACDITIASDKAAFSVPEMAHQIMPTMVMSSFVDRVPRKAMAYLVYSMFEVTPERALSYGIVSDVVPAAQLDAHVDKLTAAMLKAPSISLRSAKEYVRSAPDMPVAGAIEYARNLHATINSAAEIEEAPHVKVFIFDLLPYDRHFEDFKRDKLIPYPLPRDHWDPEVGARTYEQHLAIWEEMDRLGFDGVGLNEHHTTPHGLMISPNMMAAAAAQRTKRLKFLILGNLLPIHNPLRIAEELAMADCMSRGRILSGFARGVPREYNVYNVSMAESRARFEEAVDIVMKAWTEPSFSHDGKYWQMKDIAIWPRPYQQPHPPVWIPFTGSKETIEWAGRHNFSAVLPDFKRGLTEDIVGYFSRQLAKNGHAITPEHLCFFTDAFVADDKAAALQEYGPYYFYFVHTLWHHGSTKEKEAAIKTSGYVSSSSFDYVREENRSAAGLDREKMKAMTKTDVEKRIDDGLLAFGNAKYVTDKLIADAERYGANSLLLMMNLGAMPNDVFIKQLRRFAQEVLPKLQAHQVKRVPAAA